MKDEGCLSLQLPTTKLPKAPSALSSTGQAVDGVAEKVLASVLPKSLPGVSEGVKAHKSARRSYSRSSRSKSYSRSFSPSRSRSYSRSRSKSRSPPQNRSRSSSDSKSDSEKSQRISSNKKNSLDKEWQEYYSSLSRIKNIDKYISLTSSQDAHSGSEHRTGSECSPEVSVSRRSASLEKVKEKSSSEDLETKNYTSAAVESFNNESEWDSDSDTVNQSNSATLSKKQKQEAQSSEFVDRKLSPVTGWNSESDSENKTTRTVAISEKEEGEASSDSDFESCRKASEAQRIAAASASGKSEGSPAKAAGPEKQKSKKKAKRKHKHKRRSENKTRSDHSKDKGKRSKRKHQKLKETFHWQPPLEFEEEEDEDESNKEKHSPSRVDKEKLGEYSLNEKDRNEISFIKNTAKEEDRGQQRSKESLNKNSKRSEPHQSSSKTSTVKEQASLDDMDLCTPEHDIEILEPPVTHDSYNNHPELTLNSTSKSSDMAGKGAAPQVKEQSAVASMTTAAGPLDDAATGKPGNVIHFKWRPLKGTSALQNANLPPATAKNIQIQNQTNTQGVRMEIKSKSRVRPGSLFDEVRKTARLNQRPRNQESSSEERSPSVGKTRGSSHSCSPNKSRSTSRKSRSVSSHRARSRGWSHSYSRSRSRSRKSSYSSRYNKTCLEKCKSLISKSFLTEKLAVLTHLKIVK